MKLIIVDGIIGSGKTTMIPALLRYLRDEYNIEGVYIKEPVGEWKRSGMLEKFYSDIERYAFEFHIYTLTSLFNTLKNAVESAPTNAYIICERSIFSVRYMFVENLIKMNMLTPTQIEMFHTIFEMFREKLPKPDLFVWLDTPLETCMERVRSRDRINETSGVTREYQQELWNRHLAFFEQPNFGYNLVVSPQISLNYLEPLSKKSHEENFLDHVCKRVHE